MSDKVEKVFKYNPNDELLKRIRDLCNEIDEFGTSIPFVIGVLEKLPYEIALCVVSNLKYNKEMYVGTLKSMYYDGFKRDIKTKEENKKTKFKNRQSLVDVTNYKEFVYERLLTIGEIDVLIECFIDEDKINVAFEDVVNEKVNVANKNINDLINARKFLLNEKIVKNTEELVKKMEKFWIEISYKLIVDHKEKNKINTQ